jgi:uncharacterized protein
VSDPGGGVADGGSVTIVTQTRVRPEASERFAQWQREIGDDIAAAPGFVKQTVAPPSPPTQLDWVILQRFESKAAAVAWLNSAGRARRLDEVMPMLVGHDDVHLVRDGATPAETTSISAVISTRIKPGHEDAYRQWERRIAAVQSRAAGFRGYRFEPPIPGIQDDWLSILSFDTEAHLQAWLDSPERHRLLQDSESFTQDFHARIARTGFDQWFPVTPAAGPAPAAWKMNMLVLLLLYPVVFLFGFFVQSPLLSGRAGLPFPAALFIGNVVSVLLLSYLVPRLSAHFTWWLQPADPHRRGRDLAGIALVVALYAVLILAFVRLSTA